MTENIATITLTEKAQQFARERFDKQPAEYVYHNYPHTEQVARAAASLAETYGLDSRMRELVEVAAWLHDIEYGAGGAEGHEERSAATAREFLLANGGTETDADVVKRLILATNMKAEPATLEEMILKDADYSHLSKKNFARFADVLRMEWELVNGQVYSEEEWLRKNIDFLDSHQYFTTIGRNDWEASKQNHVQRLKKQLATLEFAEGEGESPLNKDKGGRRYPRGVETMFRVTLRNHIHLSRIADNKANFLLSISAIILSLLLGNLITDNKPVQNMLLPSIYFLLVCIVTMVFAILATRPNITKGEFSRDGLLNRKTNILFFGNFHNMPQDEFDWGMDQLMKREDLLYHSLTSDLYFLGKVLHKKYQYLRVAFHVFMFGLISSAIFYLIMLLFF